ncbi:MAG: FecR family protein [Flavobacteriales bacterium]|nr:FecR family protein [Flavobacteriales bacterium]
MNQETSTTVDISKPEAPKNRFNMLAIAVSVAILCFAYWSYLKITNEVVFKTNINETLTITLPDSTKVFLGANSTLKYDTYNWEVYRDVCLSGRAFFDIEKKGDFTVDFKMGNIHVLGTEFEVDTRHLSFAIKCYQGTVNVNALNEKVELAAGDGVELSGSSLKPFRVTSKKLHYTNQNLLYTNTPLKQVLSDLSFNSGVTFPIQTVEILNARFTGKLPSNDIESALKKLTSATNTNYKREQNIVILSE